MAAMRHLHGEPPQFYLYFKGLEASCPISSSLICRRSFLLHLRNRAVTTGAVDVPCVGQEMRRLELAWPMFPFRANPWKSKISKKQGRGRACGFWESIRGCETLAGG